MKQHIIIALTLLSLTVGFTACTSDDVTSAKPAKETLLVGEGREVVMSSGDEKRVVKIVADCAWTVSEVTNEDQPWTQFSVQPLRGSGNGNLVFLSDQNTGIYDRIQKIVLTTDGGLKQHITIRQKSGNPTINISDKALYYDAIPTASQPLTITSNSDWNIIVPDGADWVHLDKTSGSAGTTVVNITVDEIQTDVARQIPLTLVYGSSNAEVKIRQEGKSFINLAVSTNSLYFYSEPWNEQQEPGREEWREQSQVVNVTCNGAWRVYTPSSAESWLKVDPSSGVGNGEFTVWSFNEPHQSSSSSLMSVIIVVAGSANPQQRDITVEKTAY
jgi:hypothetical protein